LTVSASIFVLIEVHPGFIGIHNEVLYFKVLIESGRTECSLLPFLDHMLDQVARHGMFDLDIETVFKAFGQALRMAVECDPRMEGILPSTKGSL
jgi:imidazoleglycerol phosphate dehydratase HisB